MPSGLPSYLDPGFLRVVLSHQNSQEITCDLTRYRKSIVEEATTQKNRIEKFLPSCGIKLSSFLSDAFGVSGRAILEHLYKHGEISVAQLEKYLKGRLRNKKDDVALTVRGKLSPHQQNFFGMKLKHLYQLEAHLQEIDDKINHALIMFQKQLKLLDEIPGIDEVVAAAIIAGIDTDMKNFSSSAHIYS